MHECPYVSECVLFRRTLDGLPDVAWLMKEKHCKRDYMGCALYRISEAIGKENVPEGLFPNQVARAQSLICDFLRQEEHSADGTVDGPA